MGKALITGVMAGVLVVATGACSSEEGGGPNESPMVIAKTATKNGDAQSALAGTALTSSLRVLVTRDGAPVQNVNVVWATGSGGSLAPLIDQTDAEGVSASTWTLGSQVGSQSASATLSGATGSPVSFTATATEDDGGGGGATVQVLTEGPGGTRFEPADVTIFVGETVTWEWAPTAIDHNVVPDDGITPASSGALASAPKTYSYTFNDLGPFAYYCENHGGPGGIGMSGTVTVLSLE